MPEKEKLLKEIQAFLARHKMAPSRFGRLAMGDPNFLLRFRKNRDRDLRSTTIDRLRRWMAEYRPPRPTRSAGRASKQAAA